jgi:chemotaxis protein MotB
MSRRKKPPPAENHERWLVSYADFITLLFAFFVVLFAAGQTDKAKAQQVSESVTQAFEEGHARAVLAAILGGTAKDKGRGNNQKKGPGGTDAPVAAVDPKSRLAELLPSLKQLSDLLKKEIAEGKVLLSLEARGLVVSLQEAAFFDSGDDRVHTDAYPALRTIAQTVAVLPNPIRMEGHTDSIPIHNSRFRNNWELSAARSIAMMELFATEGGIRYDRMAISGYAETSPIASNDTEAGRARNRRVDILVLNERGLFTEPAGAKAAVAEKARH